MYWLIFHHTGLLEGYRAKSFEEFEEIEEWVKEMGNRIVVDDVAERIPEE